jgi:hypothetical protein
VTGVDRTYSVYVVELQAAADPSTLQPCVYVGETGLTPEARFARHKDGGRTASKVVHQFGLRLRADLSRGVGPFKTREEAESAESELAARLRASGFRVFGGQGRTFNMNRGPS